MSFIGHHANVMVFEIVSMESTNQIVAEALERHRLPHDELQPQGNILSKKQLRIYFRFKKLFKTFYF